MGSGPPKSRYGSSDGLLEELCQWYEEKEEDTDKRLINKKDKTREKHKKIPIDSDHDELMSLCDLKLQEIRDRHDKLGSIHLIPSASLSPRHTSTGIERRDDRHPALLFSYDPAFRIEWWFWMTSNRSRAIRNIGRTGARSPEDFLVELKKGSCSEYNINIIRQIKSGKKLKKVPKLSEKGENTDRVKHESLIKQFEHRSFPTKDTFLGVHRYLIYLPLGNHSMVSEESYRASLPEIKLNEVVTKYRTS